MVKWLPLKDSVIQDDLQKKKSVLSKHPCNVFREERTDFLVVLKDQWLITAHCSQLSPIHANGRHP